MTGEARSVAWILAPLNTLPTRLRRLLPIVLALVTVGGSALLVSTMEASFQLPDADQYVLMARARIPEVPQPFASRPFSPLLARGLAAVAHVPVQTGFVILAYAALLCTALAVFGLAMRTAAPRWVPLAMATVAFWPELLHGMALPDVTYAALLCGLLLCLAADRPFWAALTLFPLMISRESTSLALVCLLLVSWRRLRWAGSLLAVGATAGGTAVVHWLSAGAAGNQEHLPELLYLLAKAPWNILRAVGIVPWSNLYPFLCRTPQWQHALHLGSLRSVGVCSTSPISPLQAGMGLLTTFGLLPALVVLLWRGRSRCSEPDLLSRFCLLYGGISFVLAPMLGTWYSRLFGYAWPLFLVALPRLFPRARDVREAFPGGRGKLPVVGVFLALHIALEALVFAHERPVILLWATVLQAAGIALISTRTRGEFSASDGG